MENTKKIILIVCGFVLVVIFALFFRSLFEKGNPEIEEKSKPLTLTYWRVADSPEAFTEIFSKYKQLHPNITIEYRQFRPEEYEEALLKAFAARTGPDIFSVKNTWMEKYRSQSLIAPILPTITMDYPVTSGTIKPETKHELRTYNSISPDDLKNKYVRAVYDDVVLMARNEASKQTSEEIYGLPLSVDTLAMYYNQDLLDNAGIPEPPRFWNREFQDSVKKLTKQDAQGRISQAGVALGGGKNIEYYDDILSALMIQNGTVMMNDGRTMFHLPVSSLDNRSVNPGLEALTFYSDFANPAKEVYSWNGQLENSLELFTNGRLALMFGYSYDQSAIKTRSPGLNYRIAPLPQIEGNTSVNFANYWVEVVSRFSSHPEEAWDFVQFATREENVRPYLSFGKKPTALRSLIEGQIKDPEVRIFAEQLLTARSWYHGNDPLAMKSIMAEMIDNVVQKTDETENIINISAQKIQQTISTPKP